MATLGEINVIVGAEVEEAGFKRAENAISGMGAVAASTAAQAGGSLASLANAADAVASRYVDAQGRMREANGRFISTTQLAAEAAANAGGAVNTLNAQLATGFSAYDKGVKPLEAGIGRLGQGLKEVGQAASTYVTLPLTLLAGAAVAASAKIDALTRGLQAVTQQQLEVQGVRSLTAAAQAADLTKIRLTELREVAKLPGLGFAEAVQGSIRLQAVGISADLAKRALLAFGNAIATTGGGKSELDRVTVQLAQLSAKGKVLAQDLRPIIEAAPAVATALKKLYGTVDSETISDSLAKQGTSTTEFIGILTDELAKLPKVTGGLKNALENISDTVELNLARLGDSLNNTLNLEGVAEQVGAAISSLVDAFTSLSPGGQAAVIALLGVAAAAGPVLVAVGSLLAIVPQAVVGFELVSEAVVGLGGSLTAFATGPAGLTIAAVAAVAAGLYYLATASDRAVSAYRDQAAQADRLTGSITPLLARYEELSSKTALSAAEQEELRSVIQQLAQTVPSAVTAIDAYGKAVGVNASAVRDYSDALQQQKRAQAALALPDQEAKLKRLATTYASLKAQADEFNRTGAIQATGPALGGGAPVVASYRAGSQAVAEFQAELANANVSYQQQKQLVDELRGSVRGLAGEVSGNLTQALTDADIALKFLGGRGEETGGKLAGLREQLKELKEARELAATDAGTLAYNPLIKQVSDEIARLEGTTKRGKNALAELQKALADNGRQSVALGFDYDFLGGKQQVLQGGIKKLIEAGYNPAGAAVQGYARELQALNRLLADNSQLSARTVKGSEKLFETPEFKINTPAAIKPPEVLPLDLTGLDLSAEGLAAAYDKMIAAQNQKFPIFTSAQAQFNTDSEELLRQFPYDALTDLSNGIGAAFGSLLTGQTDVVGAFSIAAGALINALADFAEKKGKLLIALGLADLATPGLQAAGAAELAAGTALLIASGVARAGASSLSAAGRGSSLASSPSGNYSSSAASSKAQPVQVNVTAEFKLRGSDLVAVGRVAGYRELRTG